MTRLSTDTLVLPGEAEIFKLGVHLGVFGLVAACAAYNAMAFSQRRSRHLWMNTIVYVGIAWWEVHQVARHFDTLQSGSSSESRSVTR